MQTTIEMEFEYAYNAWKATKQLDDDTIISLAKCYQCTSGSEIDKASYPYPPDFITYIDVRIREFKC